MTVEELRLILRINGTTSYTHAINEVTNVTNNYTNSIGGLTSMLAKFVSAGFIAKFAKDCIEAASNLQEVSNVMNVTFGQNAAIIDQWAKTQAASFGLSEKAAKDYTGVYGTMAKQFGVSLDRATKMSIELTKLTGDVASFYNTTDKIASTKLKSIFTGETETLKELGVVMTEANLNAYAMQKGLGKTVKQMSEQEKVLLRYSFVMDKLSHTQGDFQRTSDGWANSVRLLKLNLENLRVEIGNQLLPVAGQGLAAINKGLQAVSPMLISVAQTVKYYGEAWKNASEQTRKFVKASLTVFAIGAIAPRIIAVVSSAVKLLTMEILSLGSALSGIAGVAGIILAVAAMANLTKQVSELKNASTDITSVGDSAEVSAGAVDELSDALGELSNNAEGLDTFLASFDEVNKVGGSSSLMSNLVNTDDLANIMAAAAGLDDLNDIVDGLNDTLSDITMPNIPDTSAGTFLDPAWWQSKWEGIKGFLATIFNPSEFWDNWVIGAEEIVTALKERFSNIIRFLERLGSKAYDVIHPLAEATKEIFNTVKTAIDEVIAKIEELSHIYENSSIFKFFAGAGSNLYDLQHENDSSGGDTFIYTSPSGVSREVLKYYPDGSETELYKKYKSQYNEDGSETELQKRKKRSGTIRRYSAGGLPNKGSLFIAGESGAELVSNFGGSQTRVVNQSQINNNSQPTIAFTPTIMIDGRKISAVVVDDINNTTRSTGNSPLIQMG